jgi:nucleotide-binding universal stress UspA family protein
MYKRILIPVDGSPTSNKALVAALQFARECGASVRVFHALDDLAFISGYEYRGDLVELAAAEAEKILADALAIAKSAGTEADSRLAKKPGVRLGDAVAAEALEWKADLIVIGTHGRRGLGRVIMGSGAEQVIRTAPTPVLVIRGDPEAGST